MNRIQDVFRISEGFHFFIDQFNEFFKKIFKFQLLKKLVKF